MILLLLFQTFIHMCAICAMFAAARDRRWRDWGINFVFAAAVAICFRRIGTLLIEATPDISSALDTIIPMIVSILFFAAGVAFHAQPRLSKEVAHDCY